MTVELDKLKEEFQWAEYDGDIDKLHKLCKRILEINPKLIEYKEYIAVAYFLNDEYEECINQYNDFFDSGGQSEDSEYILFCSYLQIGDESKAMSLMEGLDEEKSYSIKAESYYDLGNYEKAIEYGDLALERDCTNEHMLRIMANIYKELGDEERLLFYEEEISKLNPDNRFTQLFHLYELNRYGELIEIFENEKDSGIFDNHLCLFLFNDIIGHAYGHLDRHMDALKYLYRSNELNPNCFRTKMSIAKNYFLLRDYKNSSKFLAEALEINENNMDALKMMCEAKLYLGDFMESLSYLNKALSIYDDNDGMLVYMGAYHMENGNKKKGVECVKMIPIFDEIGQDYIYTIARNLSLIGKSERALNYYDAIVEYIPDCPITYIERASHYKRIGEKELALKDLDVYNEKTKNWHLYDDEFPKDGIKYDDLE